MDCPDELLLIEKALRPLEGVLDLAPDYLNRTLAVEFDADRLDPPRLCNQIRSIGLDAEPIAAALPVVDPWTRPKIRRWTLAGAGLLLTAAALRLAIGETTPPV